MSRSSPVSPTTTLPELSLELQLRLEEVCHAYESAWRCGKPPRLEDALLSAPESVRAVALRELIQIEIHHRRQAGASLQAAELHSRFPELDATWLSKVASAPVAAHYPTVPGYEILGLLGRGGMGVVYRAR